MGSMFAALAVVFVAELGDKTQLVALGLGARHRLAPVLVGVVAAYAATNLLSVLVGGLLGAAFPTRGIAIGGGVLFVAFAAWSLRPSAREDHDEGDPEFWQRDDSLADVLPSSSATDVAASASATTRTAVPPSPRQRSVALSVALTMFVAELGDKTMLATATLAARGNPAWVWVGATIGIVASGLLGVLLGRVIGARLPERVTRIGSALLFAVFGTVLVVTNL